MNVDDRNLLLLIVYFASLALFLFRIVQSFNDEYSIDDTALKDSIKANLNEHNLQDLVDVGFRFDKRYEFAKKNTLKQLAISITNKSGSDAKPEKHAIYVDWDYCTLTDLEGRARRVTRLNPGTTIDLSQDQIFSTIAPGTTLKEAITAEDILARKGERKSDKLPTESPVNLEVEITKPLIDLTPAKPSEPLKLRLKRFKERRPNSDLSFMFDLVFRVVGPDTPLSGNSYRIPCKFILKKLSWKAGLPWNPK